MSLFKNYNLAIRNSNYYSTVLNLNSFTLNYYNSKMCVDFVFIKLYYTRVQNEIIPQRPVFVTKA